MVNSKKKKRRTKKVRRPAAVKWIMSVVVCCCAVWLFVHDLLYYPAPQEEDKVVAYALKTTGAKPEIPQLQNGMKEQIIFHEGYTVSYNPDYKIANWVAYELTADETTGKAKRSDNFVPDPMIAEEETATKDDYSKSGYDRGHLAPAGDMKWSDKAMQESFYLSNICPQDKGLNTGIWNSLEIQCRKWAAIHGSLLIVTGPVMKDSLRRIGAHRVAIPDSFYKVICIPSAGKPRGIGFLFENRSYVKTSISSTAVSIDSVEKVTGIDFFSSFPLEVQEEMESSAQWEY
ncbi:MAG: DNA/RNA non-specific endonuclease [Tannerellaceae bacterium]|jgi:endonuclease G|nr:DNA/RNA non-specific endonuclease [Tannerellaceae bacterium]